MSLNYTPALGGSKPLRAPEGEETVLDWAAGDKIRVRPAAEMMEAALGYADKGLKVFPVFHVSESGYCACGKHNCKSIGKHPITKEGYKAATADPKTIKSWWIEHPHSNIGVACDANNLAVLDVDPRNGGLEGLAELEGLHGPITSAVEAVSGGAGRHIVFALDASSSLDLPGGAARGVDLKSKGYILAEPSNHTSGGTYRWAEGRALGAAVPTALPAWIAELKGTKSSKSNSGPTGNGEDPAFDAREAAAFAAIETGGPSTEELTKADAMRAKLAGESPAFAQLSEAGQHNGTDKTSSGLRMSLANFMCQRFGGEGYTARHHAALRLSAPFTPKVDSTRQAAREWARAYTPGNFVADVNTDGFGAVDDGSDPVDITPEPAPDPFAAARADLGVAHVFGDPTPIRAAHQALADAAHDAGRPELSKRLEAMTDAEILTRGAAETVIEMKGKPRVKRGIVLPDDAPILDLDEVPATEWLVWPLYARRVVGTLIGPAGVAKSRLALTEALAIAAGRPEIAGWPADTEVRRVSAWYHCQEDDLPQIQLRAAALRKQYGVPKSAIDGSEGFKLHLTSGTRTRLTLAWRDPETKAVVVNPDLGDIIADMRAKRIGLLVVDPATELHDLDENNASDMRVVWGAARTIAEETFAHVLVIAHSRKPDGASNEGHAGDMNTLRGSSAAVGVVRMARTVFTMSEKDAERFKVDPARRHDFLRLDDAKNNLAAVRYGPQWFERTSVDRDGLERNRIGVVIPADLMAKTSAEIRNEKVAVRERVADVLRAKFGAGKAVTLADLVAAAPDLAEAAGESASNRSRWFKRDVMGKATECEAGGGKLTFKAAAGMPLAAVWTAAGDKSEAFGAVDEVG